MFCLVFDCWFAYRLLRFVFCWFYKLLGLFLLVGVTCRLFASATCCVLGWVWAWNCVLCCELLVVVLSFGFDFGLVA